MARERWSAVDDYFARLLLPPDPVLDATLRRTEEAGLPAINVAPNQGKLLHLLARASGARRILEIGTLGGYSTIWLARAVGADGRVTTLEAEERHADVARRNIADAGLADVVDVVVGPALHTLPTLDGPFDLVFIDADKTNNAAYFDRALRLSRPGALIVVDNVVRGGAILDADTDDESVQGTRRLAELVGREPRVTATVVQTVGGKGYDGLLVALVGPDGGDVVQA